jgi:hypothetical protein
VTVVESVDAHGCPVRSSDRADALADGVAVCRYRDGWLEQSELLTGEDADAAARAIADSRALFRRRHPGYVCLTHGIDDVTGVRLISAERTLTVRLTGACEKAQGGLYDGD